MADPIVAPPPPPSPKGTRRTRELAEHGTPHDLIQARKRVQRSRMARAKKPAKIPRRTLGISLPAPIAEAVELIAERYDVPISAVQRRMIEDGVRRYGNEEEIDHAGLGAKRAQNPFDPMDTQVQETPYDRYRERVNVNSQVADNYEEEDPPPMASFVPPKSMFTGGALPSNPGAYEQE